MDSHNSKVTKRLSANNRCKTINPALKYSSPKKNTISKEKKKQKSKIEEQKININTITNNNNSHNIYVINNYFEDKKNKINSVNNIPIGLWKDGKRYDRNGNEIKKGGKQKLCFIDKIGKGKLVDTIAIESFKQYNLIEEVSEDRKNTCCFIY